MHRLRERLTYSNVMATIAVFVALGGAAYALERNSVRSKHIKNGQVRVVDADPDDFVLHDPRAGFDLGASTISHTIFNLGTAGTLDLGTLTLHRESASAFDVCAVGVTSNTPYVVYEGTGTG